jgi:hypothetical protein
MLFLNSGNIPLIDVDWEITTNKKIAAKVNLSSHSYAPVPKGWYSSKPDAVLKDKLIHFKIVQGGAGYTHNLFDYMQLILVREFAVYDSVRQMRSVWTSEVVSIRLNVYEIKFVKCAHEICHSKLNQFMSVLPRAAILDQKFTLLKIFYPNFLLSNPTEDSCMRLIVNTEFYEYACGYALKSEPDKPLNFTKIYIAADSFNRTKVVEGCLITQRFQSYDSRVLQAVTMSAYLPALLMRSVNQKVTECYADIESLRVALDQGSLFQSLRYGEALTESSFKFKNFPACVWWDKFKNGGGNMSV